MAALSRQQKIFAVERLACFDAPSEVAKAMAEEFGCPVPTRQVIWRYDASRPLTRAALSPWLVELFDATRERFRTELGDIPIANVAVRLRYLQKFLEKAIEMGAFRLAKDYLEAAAKERGGAFTNRHELTGANGGPIETAAAPYDLKKLTKQQLDELEQILEAADAESGSGGEVPAVAE